MASPTLAETVTETLLWTRAIVLYVLSNLAAIALAWTAVYATFKITEADTTGKTGHVTGFFALLLYISGCGMIIAHMITTMVLTEAQVPYPEVSFHFLDEFGRQFADEF